MHASEPAEGRQPPGRDRRALTRLVLVVAILVVPAATLLPAEPVSRIEWEQVFCVLCGHTSLADVLANAILFVPFGVGLGVFEYRPRSALLLAAALSLSVELAQLAIPGRDPSVSDVLSNTLGGALGGVIGRQMRRWAWPGARAASRWSLVAAIGAGVVFAVTDLLLAVSLPATAYFAGSASMQSWTKPLRLGGNIEPHGYFQGRIDEVRISRRARTAAEIRADMNTPVAAGARSPNLVAAYSFDDGAGSQLIDVSGHHNSGQIQGAAWTTDGKFGGALVFDGVGNVVVIPHDPALDLVDAMTLEAWIYPTATQRGWRAILQKEFDAYFLLAGSRAGPLRPGGGGTFGSSTETIANPAEVPINAWTHVAMTYDGAVMTLYINGALVSRRLRWYPGPVLAAAVGGLPIRSGLNREWRQLRARLLEGTPLRVRAVAAAPVGALTPLVMLQDAARNEVLLLAAEGEDVVFRLRTRAAAVALDSPAVRAPGLLRGLEPGVPFTVTASYAGRRYCVEVDSRSACGLGPTLGMGWAFLGYSQVPSGWLHAVLSILWVAALSFPFGFFLRRRWESALGALVLAVAIVVSSAVGGLTAQPMEIMAVLVGILVGCALGGGYATFAGSTQNC